ncbi:MAG TPA: hypothetical protein ENI44_04015 [Thermoplasmatales archaeon]|nr:hypothetical protein [Thermoplasmatales archaeon]
MTKRRKINKKSKAASKETNFKYGLIILIIIIVAAGGILALTLHNTGDGNNNSNNNSTITPNEAKKHLLGTWRWEGYGGYGGKYHQIGTWTFYENDSMVSIFQGVLPNGELGSKNIVWWHYSINETLICFDNASDFPPSEPGCYTYEFLEDYLHLRVTDSKGNSADWYKVE